MITCGNCKSKHETVAEVKDCFNGEGKQAGESLPGFVTDPATEKQLNYIRSLSDQRNTDHLSRVVHRITELWMDVMDGKQISKSEASRVINGLLGCDEVQKIRSTETWPGIPAGNYALPAADGSELVVFYEVDRPTEGKWAGHVLTALLLGSPGDWTRQNSGVAGSPKVLERIADYGVEKSARLFGQKAKRCGMCMSPLSNVRSRAAGYGQKCANDNGWYYPSEMEARATLLELGEPVEEDQLILDNNEIMADQP